MFVAQQIVGSAWLADASRAFAATLGVRRLLSVVKLLCLVLLLLFDYAAIRMHSFPMVAVMGSFTLLLLFSRRIDRFAARVRSIKSPFWNQVVRMELAEEGFRESCDLVQASFAWASFTRIIETPKGYLLFHGPKTYRWIPFTAFLDHPDPVAISTFLRGKVAKFSHSKPAGAWYWI